MVKPSKGNTEKRELLGKAALFSKLDEEELATIARYSGYRSFQQNEVVFEEGSHRAELYLIREGTVLIRKRVEGEGEKDIARFVSGEVFGEMDLLDTAPRNASAIAEEPASLLVFPETMPFADLFEKHPDVFARILRKLLGEIAGRIRAIDKLISEKTPWIEEVKKQLHRDRLSGLYNRTFLEEELAKILAGGGKTCLLAVKPDNFKPINDTFGHEAGDKTLVLIADALKAHIKEGELGVRYRGDEYCVILAKKGASDAAAFAEALREAIGRIDIRPFTKADWPALSASIGVAEHPVHATDAKALVALAFERMWEARNSGGNKVNGGTAA
jgi:diguanylate cyclase (GGDEF)-like protein